MDSDQPQGAERRVEQGIDFAAQCAKMFGFGAQAQTLEPLAMVGVHLGFAIGHLFAHHAQQQQKQQQPAQPAAAAPPSQSGQPL